MGAAAGGEEQGGEEQGASSGFGDGGDGDVDFAGAFAERAGWGRVKMLDSSEIANQIGHAGGQVRLAGQVEGAEGRTKGQVAPALILLRDDEARAIVDHDQREIRRAECGTWPGVLPGAAEGDEGIDGGAEDDAAAGGGEAIELFEMVCGRKVEMGGVAGPAEVITDESF